MTDPTVVMKELAQLEETKSKLDELHSQLESLHEKQHADLAAVTGAGAREKLVAETSAQLADVYAQVAKSAASADVVAEGVVSRLDSLLELREKQAMARKRTADKTYSGVLQPLRPPKRVRTRKNALSEILTPFSGPGKLPPLCGANPESANYRIPPGDPVVAKRGKVWILGYVVSSVDGASRYEVEDAEPDDPNEKKKVFTVPAKAVVPLPTSEPVDWAAYPAAVHKKGAPVHAMFPETTSFYPAKVAETPAKRPDHKYILHFADDEGENGKPIRRQIYPKFVVRSLPE